MRSRILSESLQEECSASRAKPINHYYHIGQNLVNTNSTKSLKFVHFRFILSSRLNLLGQFGPQMRLGLAFTLHYYSFIKKSKLKTR